jgi:hypothetical protein
MVAEAGVEMILLVGVMGDPVGVRLRERMEVQHQIVRKDTMGVLDIQEPQIIHLAVAVVRAMWAFLQQQEGIMPAMVVPV